MSIKHVDLKMPGGMYVHDPVEVTTTLVGYVPSNASLALKENGTLSLGRDDHRFLLKMIITMVD